jgi:site-specific DNA recombinase
MRFKQKKALRQSHDDAKQYHEEAIKRLQAEYYHLQNRLNSMYLDKLDGHIESDFFDLRASEWRTEQTVQIYRGTSSRGSDLL